MKIAVYHCITFKLSFLWNFIFAAHQNDCEFVGCYIRSVIGYAFVNALEQGIDSWIEGFKRPKA